MNRRALLTSVGAMGAAVLAIVPTASKIFHSQEHSDLVSLEQLLVRNLSEKEDNFNVTVVREGEVVYQGQLHLQPGETARVDANWKPRARSFAVVGMSKTFSNYEIAALDSKGEFTRTYRAEFEIQSSGDVQGGAASIEEDEPTST